MTRPYAGMDGTVAVPVAASRWWVAGLGAALAFVVAVPVLVAAVGGTLDIARNDDWSYREIALGLYLTGRLMLDHAAETFLIGQVILTQPLLWLSGGQSWAFWVTGAIAATVFVVVAYAIARHFLPRGPALLATVVTALCPGFLAYGASYMTEVPALALSTVSLAAGVAAIRQEPTRLRWLAAALAIGVVAVTIRQFALAAPVSVAIAAVLREPRRPGVWVAASVAVAAIGVATVWRSSLPGEMADPAIQPGSLARLIPAVFTLGFVLAPAVVIGIRTWRSSLRRIDVAVGLATGGVLAVATLARAASLAAVPAVMLDNLASPWGSPAYDYLTGGRPRLFADPAWWAIGAFALVFTVLMCGLVGGIAGHYLRSGRWRTRSVVSDVASPRGLLIIFVAVTSVGLSLFATRWYIFDRYLWPVLLPMAIVLMSKPAWAPAAERRDRSAVETTGWTVLAGISTAVIASVGLIYALNSNAFDGARWRAGEQIAATGTSRSEIDAGYEWLGTYAPGDPLFVDRPSRHGGLTWYGNLWPEFRRCALVSSAELAVPDLTLTDTIPDAYRLLLVAGPSVPLYIYRSTDPACQGGTSG